MLPLPSTPLTATDLSYTIVNGKIACWAPAYRVHIGFAYCAFISGLLAMLSRFLPAAYKWAHRWLGVAYIISMLWAIASSLVIRNEGLPHATAISFIWVLGFLTIGWVIVRVHMYYAERQALEAADRRIRSIGLTRSLVSVIAEEKLKIAARKTFSQRYFSLKTLHGMCFFTSWINIAGRVFVTTLEEFTCYANVHYKQPAGSHAPLVAIPIDDPTYFEKPWAKTGLVGWGVALSIGPLLGSAFVAAIFQFVATKLFKPTEGEDEGETLKVKAPKSDI
ncbi:hypothetical protein T492DRAFT_1044842 [Pavlovales sp. CCMP2436]|nr:hypothetical protein T492DRAFT_1044842 [Pavlovales sp. CCMP2436]